MTTTGSWNISKCVQMHQLFQFSRNITFKPRGFMINSHFFKQPKLMLHPQSSLKFIKLKVSCVFPLFSSCLHFLCSHRFSLDPICSDSLQLVDNKNKKINLTTDWRCNIARWDVAAQNPLKIKVVNLAATTRFWNQESELKSILISLVCKGHGKFFLESITFLFSGSSPKFDE